jgi:hypothetical protein
MYQEEHSLVGEQEMLRLITISLAQRSISEK